MRKLFKIVLIVGLLAFISIQFFQPDKNIGEVTDNHIFKSEQLPENVKAILKTSCLDCHSNHTNYLWYHKIAPVSWMVNDHIVEGKKELNLSEWGTLGTFDKIVALEDMAEEAQQKEMPLKAYTALHKEAILSDEQIAVLRDWSEKLGLKLLAAME